MRSRILFTMGMIWGLVFSPPLSAQVPGVQGCVGAGCDAPVAVPGVQGCVGMGCEDACDEQALTKAKAERAKWLGLFNEQRAAADDVRGYEAEAIKEAQGIFGDYTKGVVTNGATTVGKQLFPVPMDVLDRYNDYKDKTPTNISSTDDVLKLAKSHLESLAKSSGYKDAVSQAKWVSTAMSGIAMDAKVLKKLKEAEFHAEQAQKQWRLAYESLSRARHLEDKIRRLEAACKAKQSKEGAPPPEEEEDDAFKPSGQREAEEVQKMLENWKRVEGGFEDAQGNFYDTDQAFEKAKAIIRGEESFRRGPGGSAVPASAPSDADYQKEWNAFRVPMTRGFESLIVSLEAYNRAEAAFHQIPSQ